MKTLLSLPVVCLFASAAYTQPVLLDDYSSDANFLAGNYQFIDVNAGYSRPDENGDPPPSGALPDVTTEDGLLTLLTIQHTAGHMWIGGDKLSEIGDRVTMDITTRISLWSAPGMFFDTDLTNAYDGAEIRYQQGFLKMDKLVANAREEFDVPLVLNDPALTYRDFNDETFHYEALVTAKDEQTISLRVSMTGDFFEPAYNSVTLEGSEVFFGPSSWWSGSPATETRPSIRYTFHDNLTFIPASEPILGDLNGDGVVTEGDISAFVHALTDPQGYADQFPVWDPDVLGDFNGDGQLTNADIDGFVAAMGAGSITVIPEPASFGLLALGGFLLARCRSR